MMHVAIAGVLLLAAAGWESRAAAGESPTARFFQPLVPPRPWGVMVHRGMMRQAPENTRPAIEMAIADGLEWVEIDVRLTKDGRHVVFHDSQLDGKTSGSGAVADHPLAELQELDAGGWFARRFVGKRLLSLPECLQLAHGKINLYLDCKQVDPRLLVDEIAAADMQRQVAVFADLATLAQVRELGEGQIAIMPKWRPEFGIGAWVAKVRPHVVEIDADQVTAECCRAFHDLGVAVQAKVLGPWDRALVWDQMLAAGVDFLQTDLPEEIVAHVVGRSLEKRPVRMALHRGASRYAPENTVPALEKAVRLGADFVEIDVRTTSDGQLFLLHDGNLDRTTTGHGPIRLASAAAVAELDAGAWFGKPFRHTPVPELQTFLAAYPPSLGLYFDAKDIEPAALAEALTRHRLVERTVVYQRPDYLAKLKAINPRIKLLAPIASDAQVDALADTLGAHAVDAPWRLLSADFIAHCHRRGMQVFADAHLGVDVEGYRRAIAWGIDLIQTDHPLRLWRAMELDAARARAAGDSPSQ